MALIKNRYNLKKKYKRTSWLGMSLILLTFILIIAVVVVRYQYEQGLKPVSSSSQTILVTIPKGSSLTQIANILKTNNLIRSTMVFKEYVDSQNLRASLEAGTYALSPNQDVKSIVSILTHGKVASKLVTIIPGESLVQTKNTLINNGFTPSSVDSSMNVSLYSDMPVLTYVPKGQGLDGLIFPDSYQKINSTDPSTIVREALNEMGNAITPEYQASYAKQGLSVYQAITLASIIEREVPDYANQQQVAQVFVSRLNQNMPLESNVTAFYAKSVNNQAYNTYNQPGLPPSPLCNVDAQVLKALANPINSSYLYFVTGSDGKTRFAHNLDEHNANIAQYGQAKE